MNPNTYTNLAFIIPFKAPSASKNFPVALNHLSHTLRSADSQRNKNYRIVLVHHELNGDIDDIISGSNNIDSVRAKFLPPIIDEKNDPERSLDLKRIDKLRKIAMGIQYAKNIGAKYIMVVDADDLISNKISARVANSEQSNGWYLAQGYDSSLFCGFRMISRRPDFNKHCGSSYILETDSAPCINININDAGDKILASDMMMYINHASITDYFTNRGAPLKAINYPAAIYYRNQESIFSCEHERKIRFNFRKQILRLIRFKYANRKLRIEFSYPY